MLKRLRRLLGIRPRSAVQATPGTLTSIDSDTKCQQDWISNPKGIDLVWREGYIAFKSRESVLNRVIETLKDEDISITGVVGMGGIGKTKLVTEVGKKAKDERMFDQVVIVVISQNPNIWRIQGVLADMLDLQLKGDSEADRARELLQRLKEEERVLVILDDVWQNIDLKDVGIPSSRDEHSGCKIILTARREQTCVDMSCQKRIHLDVIDQTDAWTLFSKYARLDGKSRQLHGKAKKIVAKCGGLPLALVVVGSSLKDRSLEDYDDAIQRLSKSNFVDVESADGDIYHCLKLSYDYLSNEETKKCFLLCSLFPQEREIDLEDLTRYAIGHCLFQNVGSFEEARTRILRSMKELEDASLLVPQRVNILTSFLQDGYSTTPWEELLRVKFHSVTMHDMVRDSAFWIAKNIDSFFLVPTSEELSQPWNNRCENVIAVSIKTNDINWVFPEQMEYCEQLKILLLKNRFMHGTFQDFRSLQVLDISQSYTSNIEVRAPLPASLQYLHNLRTLHLCYWSFCRLDNISTIRSLKSLEILSLRESWIEVLPIEIGELHNLRVLDLTDCKFDRWIPQNLFPSLTRLEELYTYSECIVSRGWGVEGHADLTELGHLPNLTSFTAWIDGVHCLPSEFRFRNIQNYMLKCSKDRETVPLECSRKLILDDLDSCTIGVVKQLLQQVVYLKINGSMESFRNMFPEINDIGFENLTQLIISNSTNLECLVDTTGLAPPRSIFTNLVLLTLSNMPQLTTICHGPSPVNFLKNIRWAAFADCPKLQNILWHNFLVMLIVRNCGELQVIFQLTEVDNSEERKGILSNLIQLNLSGLPQLNYIWKGPHQNVRLSKLRSIELDGCGRLTSVFTPTIAKSMLQLRSISIANCKELEAIIVLNDEEEGFQPIIKFPRLEKIDIRSCDKLKNVLPISLVATQGLQNLENISLINCAQIEHVFVYDRPHMTVSGESIMMNNLQYLTLVDLPALKGLVPENCCLDIPSLHELTVDKWIETSTILKFVPGGKKQELVISKSQALQSLTTLKKLTIQNSGGVKELFDIEWIDHNQDHEVVLLQLTTLELSHLPSLTHIWKSPSYIHSLRFCHLTRLVIMDCQSLSHLFTPAIAITLSQLTIIKIDNCHNLEHFITTVGNEDYFPRGDEDEEAEDLVSGDEKTTCFPKLEAVEISRCERLKTLFPFPMVTALPQLQSLIIQSCSMLNNMFDDQRDKNKTHDVKEIRLPCLLFLHVVGLASHTRFSPLSYRVICPFLLSISLRETYTGVTVFNPDPVETAILQDSKDELVQMLSFSSPDVMEATWKEKIQFEPREPEDYSKFNGILPIKEPVSIRSVLHVFIERSTVEEIFDLENVMSSDSQSMFAILRVLTLSHLPNLTCIWKAAPRVMLICSLTCIKVNNCMSLKSLFTYNAAQTLISLRHLQVVNNKRLEYIIEPIDRVAYFSFPVVQTYLSKLNRLYIIECDSLKSIFPISIAQCLPTLEILCIKGARQLELIFREDREEGCEKDKVIRLSRLSSILLDELPCLTSICPPGYVLCTQSSVNMVVKECPLLDSSGLFTN